MPYRRHLRSQCFTPRCGNEWTGLPLEKLEVFERSRLMRLKFIQLSGFRQYRGDK